uniref:ZP domain-containing protein n=1 Tax=Sinocyclocheilus anshuiensis TaxID=1608454 RepID=A0A671LER6_9TELE
TFIHHYIWHAFISCTVVPYTTSSVDPCYSYTSLDEATNNQHSSQIMCDSWVSWNGWYRLFIQGQGIQMPDICVDELSCGTHAPLWLNGGHPRVEDGVVTRDVCGHWDNNCCYFQSNPIKVKACPGGYYVYEFVSPSTCHLAYCADVRDRCSELSCSEDEWCGKKSGVYGCLCNDDQPRPQANGTHFIYSNFILGTPRSEGLISREKILKLSFSCVYPQTQTLSMNVEINPLESVVHRTLPAGEGRYQVRMIPYEDDEFTRPFTGKVDAELDQKMNVEVRVEGVDSRQFSLVMETCWATPLIVFQFKQFDLLIVIVNILGCPNPNDDTVELLQNGVSTSSRFSFRMFIFTANSTKLYLHCAVHLCLLSSNSCSTVSLQNLS